LKKDPDCPICGENPTVTELMDYEAFCGIGSEPSYEGPEVTANDLAQELRANANLVLLDVREPHEWEICRLPGSQLIPLGSLPDRIQELDGHREIVTICHRGVRSMRAREILTSAGFGKVRSLRGGVDAWSTDVDTEMPRY
jgi:adenylyltransferase/sulfurtransferase